MKNKIVTSLVALLFGLMCAVPMVLHAEASPDVVNSVIIQELNENVEQAENQETEKVNDVQDHPLFIVACILGFWFLVIAPMKADRKRDREGKKRCKHCYQVIAYGATTCPYCRKDPGYPMFPL